MRRSVSSLTRCASLTVALLLSILVNTDTTLAATSVQGEARTTWQKALKAAIEKRQMSGHPVPASVTFSYTEIPESNSQVAGPSARKTKSVGKTVISLQGPAQAGYDKWPAFVVSKDLPPNAQGSVSPGDYSEHVREVAAMELPGIWTKYQFGQEPREYTIEESDEITYPVESSPTSQSSMLADTRTETQQILMGFTYEGPHLTRRFHSELKLCFFVCVKVAEAESGYDLDWGLGLRLPVQAALTIPDQMIQGTSYLLSTSITGLNWSASDYTNAGLWAYDGKEFVLEYGFDLYAWASLLNKPLFNWRYEKGFNGSEDFATPFGPSVGFPIPSRYLTPNQTGLTFDLWGIARIGVGLNIIPDLGSQRITADWEAVPGSDATGNGQIVYTKSETAVSFGPVKAGDFGPTTSAHIRLSNFHYWFSRFHITLNGRLEYTIFGYSGQSPQDFPITELDLSPLTGQMYLGLHIRCTSDFKCAIAGTVDVMDVYVSVVADKTPPVTEAVLHNGTSDDKPRQDSRRKVWYNDGSWLELKASDSGSGIAGTWWQIDDAGCSPNALSKCQLLEPGVSPGYFGTGTHTIYYFSQDKAGNFEQRKSVGPFNVDATLPDCSGEPVTNAQGQTTYLKMTAQDTHSGLKSIEPVKCDNCTVPPFIFPWGTTDPVVVEVKTTDPSKPAEVTLKLTDVAENTNALCTWKALVTTSNIAQGTSATISAVPQAQSKLRIQNGKPGLTNLRVTVNGKNFEVAGLKEGQIKTLDVSSAMQPGNKNTITLTGRGKKGGSAGVLISNGK